MATGTQDDPSHREMLKPPAPRFGWGAGELHESWTWAPCVGATGLKMELPPATGLAPTESVSVPVAVKPSGASGGWTLATVLPQARPMMLTAQATKYWVP